MAPFSFVAKEAKITACPADNKGPGWISRIDGCQSVGNILHMQNFLYGDFLETLLFIFVLVLSLSFRSLRTNS